MNFVGELIGASITERTDQKTGKVSQKLHAYIKKDFERVISCKGDQVVEAVVFNNDIPLFKDNVYNLVGKKVRIICDYTQFGIKLYSCEADE